MREKRVLVCGASGFIGRNIFERLLSDERLSVFGIYLKHCFSDSERLLRVDLTDYQETLRITKEFDCIVHAAAITAGFLAVRQNPAAYLAPNDLMNINLISAAHVNNVRQFIFLSSTAIYPPYTGRPVTEDDFDVKLICPQYETVAWTKVFGEKRCLHYAGLGNTKYTVLRPANIYGPYDKFSERGHAFPSFIAKVAEASDGDAINVTGDGSAERDLLSVKDLVNAIKCVIKYQENPFERLNVGSGSTVSIKNLVAKIIEISGKKLSVKLNPGQLSIDTKVQLDSSLIHKQYGWQPTVSLEEGICGTMDWYNKHKKHI